jgi:hypothetical protein
MPAYSLAEVPIVPPLSWTDIEREARFLISRSYPVLLNEPGPFPVDEFFEQKLKSILGFDYDVRQLPPGHEGEMDPIEKSITLSPETYDGLLCEQPRARFTGAHEFGHAVLHPKYLRELLIEKRGARTFKRAEIKSFRDPECQANAFASALLMPSHHVRMLLGKGEGAGALMRIFKVSRTAADIKIRNLSLYLV